MNFDPYAPSKASPSAGQDPFGFDADPFVPTANPRRLSKQGRDLLDSVLGAPVDEATALNPFDDPFVNSVSPRTPDPMSSLEKQVSSWSAESDLEDDLAKEIVGEDDAQTESIDEYAAVFPAYQKLGMLLQEGPFSTVTVVKRVFSGSVAESQGVTVGSVLLQINGRDVVNEEHSKHIEDILSAPRPLRLLLRRDQGSDEYSRWSGYILARISKHGESVVNIFSGVAEWQKRYFYLGGYKHSMLFTFDNKQHFEDYLADSHAIDSVHSSAPMSQTVLNQHNAQQRQTKLRDEKIVVRKIKQKLYASYGTLYVFSLDMKSASTGKTTIAKFAWPEHEVLSRLHERIVHVVGM